MRGSTSVDLQELCSECLPLRSLCSSALSRIMPSPEDEIWQIRKPWTPVIIGRSTAFLKGFGVIIMAFLLSVVFGYNLLYKATAIGSPLLWYLILLTCALTLTFQAAYFLSFEGTLSTTNTFTLSFFCNLHIQQCMKWELCMGFVHLGCLY